MRLTTSIVSVAVATVLSAFTVSATPAPVGPIADVTHTGQATWFNTGLGACGGVNNDNQHVLAIASSRFGSGGNCNQWIKITDTQTGKVAYGLTVDSCPGCSDGSLDLSPSLFKIFAPLSQGVFPISWNFEPKGFTPPN